MYYALVTYYIHFSDHIRKSQKVICSKNKFTIEQLTDKETASKITGVTSKSIYTTFGYVEVVPPFLDYSDAISID